MRIVFVLSLLTFSVFLGCKSRVIPLTSPEKRAEMERERERLIKEGKLWATPTPAVSPPDERPNPLRQAESPYSTQR